MLSVSIAIRTSFLNIIFAKDGFARRVIVRRHKMDASKITLSSYIAYLESMYKRYGNISITQLKHIERNRKRRLNDE